MENQLIGGVMWDTGYKLGLQKASASLPIPISLGYWDAGPIPIQKGKTNPQHSTRLGYEYQLISDSFPHACLMTMENGPQKEMIYLV